jgi:hypothetical protein
MLMIRRIISLRENPLAEPDEAEPKHPRSTIASGWRPVGGLNETVQVPGLR